MLSVVKFLHLFQDLIPHLVFKLFFYSAAASISTARTPILDDSKIVEQHVKEAIAKLGENIVVRQFRRIELGVSE